MPGGSRLQATDSRMVPGEVKMENLLSMTSTHFFMGAVYCTRHAQRWTSTTTSAVASSHQPCLLYEPHLLTPIFPSRRFLLHAPTRPRACCLSRGGRPSASRTLAEDGADAFSVVAGCVAFFFCCCRRRRRRGGRGRGRGVGSATLSPLVLGFGRARYSRRTYSCCRRLSVAKPKRLYILST